MKQKCLKKKTWRQYYDNEMRNTFQSMMDGESKKKKGAKTKKSMTLKKSGSVTETHLVNLNKLTTMLT